MIEAAQQGSEHFGQHVRDVFKGVWDGDLSKFAAGLGTAYDRAPSCRPRRIPNPGGAGLVLACKECFSQPTFLFVPVLKTFRNLVAKPGSLVWSFSSSPLSS